MAIETGRQLAQAALETAKSRKTLYVMGCFGAPMTERNKARYTQNHRYNRKSARKAMIRAASEDTFGFDCVCLIKGLLWGFCGDTTKTYGGAVYKANDVPDANADAMIGLCDSVSEDFTAIREGEAVWQKGHIGIYVGKGLVVECSPKWANGVQVTACANLGTQKGYHNRTWTKHGQLPFVRYDPTGQPPLLRKGSRGKAVRVLQLLLTGFGFSCGDAGADGIFGQDTLQAVLSMQTAMGLQADGIVGSATWSALLGWEV